MNTSQGFAVIVAMQIRARVLLKQTEVRNIMYFSNVAMIVYSLGNDRIGLKDYLPRCKILQLLLQCRSVHGHCLYKLIMLP